MKKLFIGLLIIAAGAGAFFYLRSKQIKIAERPDINKDLILGEWTADSIYLTVLSDGSKGSSSILPNDSSYKAMRYTFDDDGKVIFSLGSFLADTNSYTFKNDTTLLLYEGDSSMIHMHIDKLDSIGLILRNDSEDGKPVLFLKKQNK